MALFLSHFPAEVLGLILSYHSHAYLFLRLWKCGDSILNAKLSQGLTSVNLNHHKSLAAHFPLALSSLRNLRHLSYASPSWDEADVPKFLTLSKTIESLRIDLPTSLASLFAFSGQPELANAPLHRLLISDYGLLPVIALGHVFPRLVDLEIGIWCRGDSWAFIPALPATLTRLTLPCFPITSEGPQLMALLPRSLRELDAVVTVDGAPNADESLIRADWLAAPPELTYIRVLDWAPTRWNFDCIPKSLTRGSVQVKRFSIQIEDLEALPVGIEQLEIYLPSTSAPSQLPANWTAKLPPRLKTLALYGSGVLGPNISALPRTLTTLRVFGNVNCDWSALREAANATGGLPEQSAISWPPRLTDLNMILNTREPGMLALIPRTTTDLELRLRLDAFVIDGHLIITASELPPNLTRLALNFGGFEVKISFEGDLPPSLTILHCLGHKVQVDPEMVAKLPNSISTLTLPAIPHSTPLQADWTLPTQLTVLRVGSWHYTWLGLLPQSLTEFRVSHGLTNAHELPERDSDLFENLPASLKWFTILHRLSTSTTIPVFSSRSFQGLSRLILLSVDQLGAFPPETLQNLPHATLKTLKLPLTNLEPSDGPFIPPHLELLNLGAVLQHTSQMNPARRMVLEKHWPIHALPKPEFSDKQDEQAFLEREKALYH